MDINRTLYKFFGAVSTFVNDRVVSWKGQSRPYAMIQTAHRIEKGLTLEKPRKMWGWSKVEKLIDLISAESGSAHPDEFAIRTGAAVLKAYRAAKEQSADPKEAERAASFLHRNRRVEELVEASEPVGGIKRLKKEEILHDIDAQQVEKLFASRHSTRDFTEETIAPETLNHAVQMALHCPSACNRQSTKVYALSGQKRKELGFDNLYNADKYLIITGDMSAFTRAERGDWTVSASIFAAYLVLALHSLGIGSCIMRKEMIFGSKYNTAVRKACGIPRNEKIILEIAVGYYKDEVIAAYSNRKKAEEIIRYI